MSESLRDYYTVQEVGDLLGYNRQTVYALLRLLDGTRQNGA